MSRLFNKLKKSINRLSWQECLGIGAMFLLAAFIVPLCISTMSSIALSHESPAVSEAVYTQSENVTVVQPAVYETQSTPVPAVTPAPQTTAAPENTPAAQTVSDNQYTFTQQPAQNTPVPTPPPHEATGSEQYIPPQNDSAAVQQTVPEQQTLPAQEITESTPAPQNTAVYSSDELPEYEMKPYREMSELLSAEVISLDTVANELSRNVNEIMPGAQTRIEINSEGGITLYASMPTFAAAASAPSWKLGPNGCLLYSDGTESDIYPIEENGTLSCGVRRVVLICDNYGNVLDSIPAGTEGVDYFTEEYQEKVELYDSEGNPTNNLMITVSEASEESSEYRAGWQFISGRVYFFGSDGKPVKGLKQIDGKYYLFDSTGVKAKSIGVDVSCFNGSIDWSLLKSEGIEFAIIRVAGRTWGTGTLFEDSRAVSNLLGASAAGLEVGAYVYSNAINPEEARQEALLACEVIRKAGVSLVFPLYFDVEYSGEYPSGRADMLGTDERVETALSFCSEVSAQGFRPGVYSGASYWKDELSYNALSNYAIWVASYISSFERPSYPSHGLWQFSSSGRLSGCGELLDLNAIF